MNWFRQMLLYTRTDRHSAAKRSKLYTRTQPIVPRDLLLMLIGLLLIMFGLLTELSNRGVSVESTLGTMPPVSETLRDKTETLRGSVLRHFTTQEQLVVLPMISMSPRESVRVETEKRTTSVMRQLAHHGLQSVPIPILNDPDQTYFENRRHTLMNALEYCADSRAEKCLIMQDSAVLHPHIVDELEATVAELPAGWHVLHMCPGFFWGRLYRKKSELWKLHPEAHLGPYLSAGDRVFTHWPYKSATMGGPVAMLVNSLHAREVAERLTLAPTGVHEDVMLRDIHTEKHFVAREPQLCYEELQRGEPWH